MADAEDTRSLAVDDGAVDGDNWKPTEELFIQHALSLSQCSGAEDDGGDAEGNGADAASNDKQSSNEPRKSRLLYYSKPSAARVSSVSEYDEFDNDDLDDEMGNLPLQAIIEESRSPNKTSGPVASSDAVGGNNLSEDLKAEAEASETPYQPKKRRRSLFESANGKKRRRSNGSTTYSNTLTQMWPGDEPSLYGDGHRIRIAPGTFKQEPDGSVYMEGRVGKSGRLFKVGEMWESDEEQFKRYAMAFTIERMFPRGTTWKARYSAAWMKLENTFVSGEHSEAVRNHTGSGWVLVERHAALPEDGTITLSKLSNRVTEDLPNERTSLCYEMEDAFTYSFHYRLGRPQWSPDGDSRPTTMDVFAGAGGTSLGLQDMGCDVKYKIEWNEAACNTLRINFPEAHVMSSDIGNVLQFSKFCDDNGINDIHSQPAKAKVLYTHGSPPCQGFSMVNTTGGVNDRQNNKCTLTFLDLVKFYQPKFVSMENVVGMKSKGLGILMTVVAGLLVGDFQVRLCKLVASDFGVPQNRPRMILLAAKRGWKLPPIPEATHGPGKLPRVTAGEALRDLEGVCPTETGRARLRNGTEIWDHYMEGTAFSPKHDNDYKLDADAPANTIRKGNHIKHYKLDRYLTARERARLQSFPDSFRFYRTPSEITDQIGNAVPPELGRALGRSILESYHLGRHRAL